MIIQKATEAEFDALFSKKIAENGDVKLKITDSLYHLKMTYYEWKKENNWASESSHEYFAIGDEGEILGATFFTYTKTEPRHICLRHIFSMENGRGVGVAKTLYNFLYRMSVEDGVRRIRVISNIPATEWHVKCGMRFIGTNKAKQPFTYLPLFDFPTLKEYGQYLDEIGPERALNLALPQLSKQMKTQTDRGGRWYTPEEFNTQWGTEFDYRSLDPMRGILDEQG